MNDDEIDAETSEDVGYGRPPTTTRFRKGQSGNPRGRPRNRKREIPHDAILGQMVTIREDGRERRVTAAEAFLLQLTQKGLGGDNAAARSSLEAIDKARAARQVTGPSAQEVLTISFIGLGIETILDTLGIAKKKYPRDESRVRWELNPWIVETALQRIGPGNLTADEQREVFANTRTRDSVEWPGWWDVRE